MLTVEDCLLGLNQICIGNLFGKVPVNDISNTWDRRFIADVATHAMQGNAISTSQSEVVLKLVTRYRDHLIAHGFDEPSLDALIRVPLFKTQPYQSSVLPREVRWAGDNKLIFRCKFNSGIVEDIKKLKGVNHFLPMNYPSFYRDHKLWVVDVNSGNWEKVMDVIKRHRFDIDDNVAQYFLEITNAVGQRSKVETDGESIQVTVNSDDFLNAWLNGIKVLEG